MAYANIFTLGLYRVEGSVIIMALLMMVSELQMSSFRIGNASVMICDLSLRKGSSEIRSFVCCRPGFSNVVPKIDRAFMPTSTTSVSLKLLPYTLRGEETNYTQKLLFV